MASVTINVGQSITPTIVVKDAAGNTIPADAYTLTWAIGDSTIISGPAQFNSFTALKAGTTTITCTATPVGGGTAVSAPADNFAVSPAVLATVTVTWGTPS